LELDEESFSTWARYFSAPEVFPDLMEDMSPERAVSNELWVLLEDLEADVEDAESSEKRELVLCKLEISMKCIPFAEDCSEHHANPVGVRSYPLAVHVCSQSLHSKIRRGTRHPHPSGKECHSQSHPIALLPAQSPESPPRPCLWPPGAPTPEPNPPQCPHQPAHSPCRRWPAWSGLRCRSLDCR